MNYKKVQRNIFRIFVFGFAVIGLAFTLVFFAMKFHLTDVKGSIDSRNSFFNEIKDTTTRVTISKTETYDWSTSPEWIVLKDALIKDKDSILRVSGETGVPARVIVASIIPEQLRFFTSNRESFKRYFEPLKLLGNATRFSYGVAGLKIETAQEIENNLKDPASPYYLGKDFESVFVYNTTDIDAERMTRLTDTKDHYFSYLYTAIYLKEIMTQWRNASFSIDNRPEVLATLFNLGFNKSVPKETPLVGGSTVTLNGKDYTFGGLAYEFYYSPELSDIFPIAVQ